MINTKNRNPNISQSREILTARFLMPSSPDVLADFTETDLLFLSVLVDLLDFVDLLFRALIEPPVSAAPETARLLNATNISAKNIEKFIFSVFFFKLF